MHSDCGTLRNVTVNYPVTTISWNNVNSISIFFVIDYYRNCEWKFRRWCKNDKFIFLSLNCYILEDYPALTILWQFYWFYRSVLFDCSPWSIIRIFYGVYHWPNIVIFSVMWYINLNTHIVIMGWSYCNQSSIAISAFRHSYNRTYVTCYYIIDRNYVIFGK